jgi:KaiC/GvpD/RAD55 family RecA-like ATPase
VDHTNTDMILSNLIHDSQFANVVLGKFDEKYMTVGPTDVVSEPHKFIFQLVEEQYKKTGVVPSIDALSLLVTQNMKMLHDSDLMAQTADVFEKMKTHICKDDSLEFRISQTQNHCQTVESQIALIESAKLLDKIDRGESDRSRSEVIDIMSRVFDIDFDPDLGSALHEDIEEFWDSLHDNDALIPFDIKPLDDAIAGGLKRNGLTLVVGCTNVGKTALMCDFTARFMQQGRNVLYITKEISEVEVKERVYANVLNMPTAIMKDPDKTPKAAFVKRVSSVLDTCGKVYVKHDDSNTFNAEDVRVVVQGLEKKKSIKFDIVIVDNLSNMSPITMKRSGNVRGDEILVKVAEELRNLSFKIDAHVIAPEQTTLECEYKLHPELSDIANAKGISRVVDNAFTIGVNEEFMEAKMIMVTVRKTRSKNSRGRYFRLGFDYSKQKTYEIDGPIGEVSTNDTSDVQESDEGNSDGKFNFKKLTSERITNRAAKNASRKPLMSI